MEEQKQCFGFDFNSSFLKVIEKFDNHTQLKLYQAISNYALRGIILENMSAYEKSIFELLKPQIDASCKYYSSEQEN